MHRMDFLDSIEDHIRRIEQQMFRIEMMEDVGMGMPGMGGRRPERAEERPAEPERVNLARFMTQINAIESRERCRPTQANFVEDLSR